MTNPAFEAAKAGGSVDTAVGFPKSREEMYKFYGFIRKQTRDAGEQGRRRARVPRGLHVQGRAQVGRRRHGRPGADPARRARPAQHPQAIVTPYDGPAERALREYPDRFFAGVNVDPNEGMEALRKIDRAAEEYDLKCVHAFPAGLYPQVAINDKKFYPIYMKCVELDIPFCSTAGVPGPRIPYEPQDVAHIDEVCWFFPELKFVTRHGCEPWADLAVKLLLKWPNLYYSTTAFAPKYYPKEIIDFANTRGADKVICSGYFPAGLTYDRIFARAARRAVPRPRVAQVPARERQAGLQAAVSVDLT